MAITGAPAVLVGGVTSSGTQGDFNVKVADASLGSAKTGRPQLILDLVGHNDPDHPGKEGKKVGKLFQSLVMEGDDKDKAAQMQGILRRQVYDACGIKWPESPKPLDPRQFVGKTFAVRFGDKGGRSSILATAPTKDKLPVKKEEVAAANGAKAPKAAAASRR